MVLYVQVTRLTLKVESDTHTHQREKLENDQIVKEDIMQIIINCLLSCFASTL